MALRVVKGCLESAFHSMSFLDQTRLQLPRICNNSLSRDGERAFSSSIAYSFIIYLKRMKEMEKTNQSLPTGRVMTCTYLISLKIRCELSYPVSNSHRKRCRKGPKMAPWYKGKQGSGQEGQWLSQTSVCIEIDSRK